jgi:hypothetical protein
MWEGSADERDPNDAGQLRRRRAGWRSDRQRKRRPVRQTSNGGAYGYGTVFEMANPGDIDLTVYNGKAFFYGPDTSRTLLAF